MRISANNMRNASVYTKVGSNAQTKQLWNKQHFPTTKKTPGEQLRHRNSSGKSLLHKPPCPHVLQEPAKPKFFPQLWPVLIHVCWRAADHIVLLHVCNTAAVAVDADGNVTETCNRHQTRAVIVPIERLWGILLRNRTSPGKCGETETGAGGSGWLGTAWVLLVFVHKIRKFRLHKIF